MKPIIFILFLGFWNLVIAPTASAAATCTASVSPSSVVRNTTSTYSFSVNNTGGSDINWIKVSRPSAATYTLTSNTTPSDWGDDINSDYVLFTDSTLSPSSSMSFTITAVIADFTADPTSWTILASDTAGSSTSSCTGSLGTSITNPPSSGDLTISGVTVSSISETSAIVSWLTNRSANSVVQYGTTLSYGSSKSDSTQTTSHGLTLTGLSANTTYHYSIQSSESSGLSANTSDSTFTTAVTGTTTTITLAPTDTTVPVVVVNFDSTKPYTLSPKITGTASDNQDVSLVEYSINDIPYAKANMAKIKAQSTAWDFTPNIKADSTYTIKIRARDTAGNTSTIHTVKFTLDKTPPVIKLLTDISKPFTKSPTLKISATDSTGIASTEYSLDSGTTWTKFENLSLTPPHLLDGNYDLKIRAFDLAGNYSLNAIPYTLIIDRLPPQTGTLVISLGPQIINPSSDGTFHLLANMKYKFTLSIIGGAINASILNTHNLVIEPSTGLWSTTASLTKGQYPLTVSAIDGANNSISEDIANLTILPPGNSAPDSIITAYVFDPISQSFVMWNAAPFSQSNPAHVSASGEYSLVLPSGKYYLKAQSPGYRSRRTSIFTLQESTPITFSIPLTKSRFLWFWPSASLSIQTPSPIPTINSVTSFPENPLLPPLSLHGKSTIVTLINTWHPVTPSQMTALSKLNAIAVFPHQSPSQIDAFAAHGKYTSSLIADPDGELVEPLKYTTSPTHYFLDKTGTIRNIRTGYLSNQQLIDLIPK